MPFVMVLLYLSGTVCELGSEKPYVSESDSAFGTAFG